jgi:hypothetical protein
MKDIKKKTHNSKANTYFNQQSFSNDLIPDYAHFTIYTTSPASDLLKCKLQTITIKEGMKFMFINKIFYQNSIKYTEYCTPTNALIVYHILV